MNFHHVLTTILLSLLLCFTSVGQVHHTVAKGSRGMTLEQKVELLARQVKFLKKEVDQLKSRQRTTEPETSVKPKTSIAAIYRAMKIENVRTLGSRFSVGDEVTVAYDLTNTSDTELRVPLDETYSRPFYLVGTKQHWIQRLGSDWRIPSMPTRIARVGTRYAAGGSIIQSKPTVPAGESLPMEQRISTKGFPAGKYRYTIEYKKLRSTAIQTKTIEFELVAGSSSPR